MAFDLKGAFASVTDNAQDAAIRAASEQLKGVYAAPVEVSPQYVATPPAGQMATSLPPETTGAETSSGGLMATAKRYWKVLAIAGVAVVALVALGKRKRK